MSFYQQKRGPQIHVLRENVNLRNNPKHQSPSPETPAQSAQRGHRITSNMEKNAEQVFTIFFEELSKLAEYDCDSKDKKKEKKEDKKEMDKEAADHPKMKAMQEKMKAKMDDKDGDGKKEPDSEEMSAKERLAKLKEKKGK